MTCPSCNGAKTSLCHIHTAKGPHEWRRMACRTCKGTGEVSEAHAQRLAEGERLRKDRIDRGITLREEAKRLGITPVELSAREHPISEDADNA